MSLAPILPANPARPAVTQRACSSRVKNSISSADVGLWWASAAASALRGNSTR